MQFPALQALNQYHDAATIGLLETHSCPSHALKLLGLNKNNAEQCSLRLDTGSLIA
jgi:hypothetical protein